MLVVVVFKISLSTCKKRVYGRILVRIKITCISSILRIWAKPESVGLTRKPFPTWNNEQPVTFLFGFSSSSYSPTPLSHLWLVVESLWADLYLPMEATGGGIKGEDTSL